jgi:hypothetical protein
VAEKESVGPLEMSFKPPPIRKMPTVKLWPEATQQHYCGSTTRPRRAPGVPEEETIAIIALNRNSMEIMGQVTVALPEGRAAIV